MKTTVEKVTIVKRGLKYRAKKRFELGNYTNPFAVDGQEPSSDLKRGMYRVYKEEMSHLLNRRLGKMWRPDDWKNLFNPATVTAKIVFTGKPVSLYEASEYGADAMLEALKGKGVEIEEGDYASVESDWWSDGTARIPRARHEYLGKGWLVFIPEEEE